MDFSNLVSEIVKLGILTPACLMSLVCLLILYRLLISREKVIEKLSDALAKNTGVMTELKTLLQVFMGQGGGR